MITLTIATLLIQLFLIILILLRTPSSISGLTSFANQSNMLGSASEAEKTLNSLTVGLTLSFIVLLVTQNLID